MNGFTNLVRSAPAEVVAAPLVVVLAEAEEAVEAVSLEAWELVEAVALEALVDGRAVEVDVPVGVPVLEVTSNPTSKTRRTAATTHNAPALPTPRCKPGENASACLYL